jgi:hypothetical protein
MPFGSISRLGRTSRRRRGDQPSRYADAGGSRRVSLPPEAGENLETDCSLDALARLKADVLLSRGGLGDESLLLHHDTRCADRRTGGFGCGDLAGAADLPLKAQPQAPADASPFWAEMDYLAWRREGRPAAGAGDHEPDRRATAWGIGCTWHDGAVRGFQRQWRLAFGRPAERGILVRSTPCERHRGECVRPRADLDRIWRQQPNPGAAVPRRHQQSAEFPIGRLSRSAVGHGDGQRNFPSVRRGRALPPRHRRLRGRAFQPACRLSLPALLRPARYLQ